MFRRLIKFVNVRFDVYSFTLKSTYRYKGSLEVRLVFREYSIGARTTISKRSGYYSGTPEVRMRYTDIFDDLGSKIES